MVGKEKRNAQASATYLLNYEKQRLLTCAKSFEELAKIFTALREEESPIKEKKEDRHTLLWRMRLQENREFLAGHLTEIAEIIGQVVQTDAHAFWYPQGKIKQISKVMLEEGILVEDIYRIEEESGKSYVAVSVKTRKEEARTTEELAGYMSVLLDRHLQLSLGSPYFITTELQTIYLEETAPLIVLTGFAKATKETEKISGDNHVFFETKKGEYIAALSDGMGSGEKACKDSELVIEMAERFLQTGITSKKTVKMINDYILAGGEEENMSTLDLCSVDLYEKEASFMKIGSSYSYLKRQETVEKIEANTFPLGAFPAQQIQEIKRELQDGDYIIMLSDGITDCLMEKNMEEEMEEYISGMPWERPSEIANRIMKEVLQLTGGKIKDDMTVLVMGFWENDYED